MANGIIPLRRIRAVKKRSKVLFRFTSIDDGHRHKWKPNLEFTSRNNNHTHRVDVRRRLALPNRKGAHRHRLL